MHSHVQLHERQRRLPLLRNELFHLGWRHYWVLVAALGGILGLIAFVLMLHLAGTRA